MPLEMESVLYEIGTICFKVQEPAYYSESLSNNDRFNGDLLVIFY